MPLRDHFHSPVNDDHSWEGFHGQWPAMMVLRLMRKLPPGFRAEPRVHPGGFFEVDVAAYAKGEPMLPGSGGTALWTVPKPSLDVGTSGADPSEYEVLVFEAGKGRRLVAAVEIVSPSNKDRPESRRGFVAKCAAYVQKGVSVTIVDAVTIRKGNLYGDLLDLFGQEDKSLGESPPPLYAATCRRLAGDAPRFQAWSHVLQIGQPLPTLPLWLDASRSIPLDLEESYEDTCQGLGID